MEPWELRFQAPRHTLPAWAKQDPDRCVFVADLTGTSEVHVWDRRLAGQPPRQVTDRPNGTLHCAIESSGRYVWWFADTEGDEFGVWMRQPFEGGVDQPVSTELKPAWQAGLAIGMDGYALVGRSTEDEGTSVHLLDALGRARTIYQHLEPAYAVDLARDLSLALIEHSESGNARNPGVRVLRPDGETVLDLYSPDHGYSAVGFAPVVNDQRLLVLHETTGRWEPLLIDLRTRSHHPIDLGLPGDLDVSWCQDGLSLLVHHQYHGRSELYDYRLSDGALTALDIPSGTVAHVRTRPGGVTWYLWSSAAKAPMFRATDGAPGPRIPGPAAPDSVGVADLWVDGPAGRIHSLLSRPPGANAPHPAIFLLHGGPEDHDRDEFDPETAAWVDHGFAVLRVNYRGSTGYGKAWRDALHGDVGLIELADITAVRKWAVEQRLIDPRRLVLAGSSWGGYLTLLGLGREPDDWAVGLADAPIADYPTAYRDTMEDVRAMDRALFGGTPDSVSARYRQSSPLTYAAAVRAPVLITAGHNDPRCPMSQIDNYVNRLGELGKPHLIHRLQAGHESAVTEDRTSIFQMQLSYVHRHLPG